MTADGASTSLLPSASFFFCAVSLSEETFFFFYVLTLGVSSARKRRRLYITETKPCRLALTWRAGRTKLRAAAASQFLLRGSEGGQRLLPSRPPPESDTPVSKFNHCLAVHYKIQKYFQLAYQKRYKQRILTAEATL